MRITQINKRNSLLEHYESGRYKEAEILALSLTVEYPNDNFSYKILAGIFKQTFRLSEAMSAN
jgi:hypothetical protein